MSDGYNSAEDFRFGGLVLADVEDETNATISWDGEGLIISTGPSDREVPVQHIIATDTTSIYRLRDFLNNVIAELERGGQ